MRSRWWAARRSTSALSREPRSSARRGTPFWCWSPVAARGSGGRTATATTSWSTRAARAERLPEAPPPAAEQQPDGRTGDRQRRAADRASRHLERWAHGASVVDHRCLLGTLGERGRDALLTGRRRRGQRGHPPRLVGQRRERRAHGAQRAGTGGPHLLRDALYGTRATPREPERIRLDDRRD